MDAETYAPTRGPGGYDELRRLVGARYPELSARLRQIAEYALAHPNDIALETVAVVAVRAGVQPSALVRFAQAMGYDGFSEMQRVFRTRLVERIPSYEERLRDGSSAESRCLPNLLHQFVAAGHGALDRLEADLDATALERAITLLAEAEMVHLMAQRRAFPVAAYMAYGLSHLAKRMQLLDGIGGMLAQQARSLDRRDALVAVSFRPYAEETVALATSAHATRIPLVTITDGPLSPIARLGDAVLFVDDGEVRRFRTLTASMCLATTIVVGLGQRLVEHPEGTARL